MKKKKYIFYNGGKPCTPFNTSKIKPMSKEDSEALMKRLEEAQRMGKVITFHQVKKVTEHQYLNHMIKENELIENYEECARLLKLKNETPNTNELTRTII